MENVRKCKNYINKLFVNHFINKEFEVFYQLQNFFLRPMIFYYFDFKLQLFINFDVSKKFGIDKYIYHVFINLKHFQNKFLNKKNSHPKKNEMKLIMFVSRELTNAKTRYWPIEIKVAALVWIIKKIRHLIKTTEHPTVVYIDHSAIAAIAQQSSLNMIFVIKLNFRLIRSSKYLQRFRLNICHIQNKTNTISDALSRLASSNGKKEIEKNVLAAMSTSVYFVMIVHMADEFKTKIINNYANHYLKIIDFIIANNELDFYATSFSYVFKWGFLYYKDSEKGLRFCIPDNMTKKIFEQTYDQSRHSEFVVKYERIIENLYIFKLSKKLRDYIKNYSQCELNQIFRYSFYETLQSIINFLKPFHIITIDFIITLPESKKNKFDCVISMIDKFLKTVTFITNYIAKSDKWWTIELFNHFVLINWELFYAIIFDQNSHFIKQIWRRIFKALKILFNYNTAYHPQTDDMFKRINQTAEIAFRYWITTLISIDEWLSIFLRMQLALNNLIKYSSILQIPAQMLYEFKLREPLDFIQINDY